MLFSYLCISGLYTSLKLRLQDQVSPFGDRSPLMSEEGCNSDYHYSNVEEASQTGQVM